MGYSTTSDLKVHPYDTFFIGDALRGARIGDYVNLHGDSTLGQFILPILFQVQCDEIRNKQYVDMGTQVIGMENNKGIVSVSMPQEEDNTFIIRSAGMNAVASNLLVGQWQKNKKCWVEGTRLYFYDLNPLQTQVLVKAIPSLFYWVHDNPQQGQNITNVDWNSALPQPLDFNAFLIEGARAWLEEQKYFPTNKDNTGVPTEINPPRTILGAGVPKEGIGGAL